MTKNAEISTRLKGDVSVIDIRGDVTPAAAAPIEDAYRGITAAGGKKILLAFRGFVFQLVQKFFVKYTFVRELLIKDHQS